MDRIEKLKEFLKETPGDNFLQHALALEWVKLGNNDEAQVLFEEILSRDPSYVGSYYHLAQLFERLGKNEEAKEWYEKGMEAARKAGDKHALGELRTAYDDLTT